VIDEAIVYPCVTFDATDSKLLFTVPVSVLVDNQTVCECHNIFSAICALFLWYYIFNIMYAPTVENVMLFLDTRFVHKKVQNHTCCPAVYHTVWDDMAVVTRTTGYCTDTSNFRLSAHTPLTVLL